MVNPRNKGSAYERDVRVRLEDELGLKFERVLAQWREAELPDLLCEDDAFPFVIECKRYQKTSAFADPRWWDQACAAAAKAGKMPALVYKGDRLEERWRVPIEAMAMLATYSPAMDKFEKYDWRFACEMSFMEFCMICRDLLANGQCEADAIRQFKAKE